MLPDYNDITKRLQSLRLSQVDSLIAADNAARNEFIRGRIHGLDMAISVIEDERQKVDGDDDRQISNAPAARNLSIMAARRSA